MVRDVVSRKAETHLRLGALAPRTRCGTAGRAHHALKATAKSGEVLLEVMEHTQGIGGIVTNLLALETVLRYFLLKLNGEEVQFPNVNDREAKITQLTRFASLSKLISEYHATLSDTEKQYAVDTSVVRIRDAFAHGRLLTSTEIPARLWKFGPHKFGQVDVEFCEELTAEWLTNTTRMLDQQRKKVIDCFHARGYQGLR
jgi:hypothetical protein